MNAALRETAVGATGADPVFRDVSVILPPDFTLESGERLSSPELKVRLHGDLSRPVVAVAGGISSTRCVANGGESNGWWHEVVAEEGPVDLQKFCVLSFDFLPNPGELATTFSTKDQASILAHALRSLGIDQLYAFVGASYGGMIALAFAAAFPERIKNLAIVSAGERPHPAATALRGVQRRIVEFARQGGDPAAGVSLARQLAMISYRTPEEFSKRFDYGPGRRAGDPHPVCDYLIARGSAYTMPAERYLALSDSIDRHQVACNSITAATLLVAAQSDRLVPAADMRRVAEAIPRSKIVEIGTVFGHDAFLKETASIGPYIKEFLEERLA